MIPIQLKIKGIYSYQNEVTINFNELTQAGIFGIFGAVGSGKSSILEAISFVLYGQIERLNSKEGMAYNMMNLKSNQGFIEFEFSHKKANYLFKYTASRNKKKFETVTGQRSAYIKNTTGSWEALESVDASNILGLSYNHFKQIVIIPQGKFNEFVHLSSGERTKLLKELFPLEQFDLHAKASQVYSATKSQYDVLIGSMNIYTNITPELLAEKNELFESTSLQLQEVTIQHEKAKQQHATLKALNEKAQELSNLKTKFEALQIEKEAIIQLKTQVDQSKLVEQLEPHYNNYKTAQQKILSAQKELEQLTTTLQSLESQQQDLTTRLTQLEDKWGNESQQQAKITQLKLAVELHEIVQQKKELTSNLESINNAYVEGKKQAEAAKTKLIELEKYNAELSSKLYSIEALNALKDWHYKQNSTLEKCSTAKVNLEETKANLAGLKSRKIQFIQVCSDLIQEPLNWVDLPINQTIEQTQNRISELVLLQETLERKLEEATHLQALNTYAETLNEGDACPLCGSHEHPNIFSLSSQNEVVLAIKADLKSTTVKIQAYTTLKTQLEGLVDQFKAYKKQESQYVEFIEEQNKILFELTTQKSELELFFEEEVLKTEEKKQATIREQLKSNQSQLTDLNSVISKAVNQDLIDQKNLIEQELAAKNSLITHYQNQIEESLKSFERTKLNSILTELEKASSLYQTTKTELQDLTNNLTSLKAEHNALTNQFKRNQEELQKFESVWKSKVESSSIGSTQEFEKLQQTKIDIAETEQKITNFQYTLRNTEEQISSLEKLLKESSFSSELYQNAFKLLNNLTEELLAKTSLVAEIKHEVNELKTKLEAKQLLQQQIDNQQKRLDNCTVILNLLKGSKFIQYVSSMYLNQLCAIANTRFKKLTQNKLELLLDANNNFIVRDYLNNGKTRLLKTLSGGQTFQAALCLALALSEQIQAQHQLKEQFFFMDEGFGSLDKESLSVVFDSLKQLKKENRIVGVISHVDDLQQEIDYHLKIVNHPESGSTIYANV